MTGVLSFKMEEQRQWDLFDDDFFAQVYEMYLPRVFQFFYSRLGDQITAEDLAGDVFLKAFEKRGSFHPGKSDFPVWLFAIARNHLIDYYRRQKPVVPLTAEIVEACGPIDENAAEEIRTPENGEFWKEMEGILTEKEILVIRRRYVGGCTNRRIAADSGMNEHTVSTLHRRALQKLREHSSIFSTW